MSNDVKQVKVDNWGIYFLQRLKHFFNRTDYCDLTLQFQDNAQLKVHRLVLSACTEYFELLERTCEMYEDCLVMPDDLQADIVVPIVNFMYTGQLEFRMELLEKLHQCSEIMNMPVLTKLLDSHRPKHRAPHSYKHIPKRVECSKEIIRKITPTEIVTTSPVTYKRSKIFEKTTVYRDKKVYLPVNKPSLVSNGGRPYREPSPIPFDQRFNKKVLQGDPRPTRYELPEELDTDNIFENSFCSISYTSQPLMVHPETRKQYGKRPRMTNEASTSKKLCLSTVDIIERRKPIKVLEDALFEDSIPDESEMYSEQFVKAECSRDSNQLFDQILDRSDEAPKVTIETKSTKSANLDHAKIISEVLKKYPHLVKSNKNIKLKILNPQSSKKERKRKLSPAPTVNKPVKIEKELDYTFETDVLDSKQAAKLIALGAENVEGPWICLICGAPGKAMNFTSYYKFRRHLVEKHDEKPVLNMCEYCGHRLAKRNLMLHHLYTKHGVDPPSQYNFPKCNQCSYIALSEILLAKHKTSSHSDVKNFRCNICPSAFYTSNQLKMHIQNTGHKISDKKANLQCIYCLKTFMRESNLYAHLKTHHKKEAIRDGIIDDSEDDICDDKKAIVKSEPLTNEFEELDIQYQIQQRPDGNITIVTKNTNEQSPTKKQKILNTNFSAQTQASKNIMGKSSLDTESEYVQETDTSSNDTQEDIILIGNNEYIMKDNQLIPRRSKQGSEEYILSDHGLQPVTQTASVEYTQGNIQHANMLLKNTENVTHPIPIYVSNEEEYKALMASNQPILFDSGDSNKTLTVLTAPHASTLETNTIDINTAQSNDMMIIQDEYPLNVSEAVTPDNPNIVVVYSHQVGDENKQYQLLTTQGLGPQFVQSSAILTQNYQTVTTTAPIMNTHVLEKEVAEAWHNNLHQIVDTNQIEITPMTTLHSIIEQTNEMQTQSLTNVAETNTEDLPQVELTSNAIQTTNSIMIPVEECRNMVVEEMTTSESLVENTEDVQNTYNMEVNEEHTEPNEGPLEHTVEETVVTIDSTNPLDTLVENEIETREEIVPNNETVMEETEFIESQTYTQPESDIVLTTDCIDEIEHQSEEMSIDSQTGEIVHEEEPDTNLVSDVLITSEQRITEDVSEKVQTLTSEWSEEETQERHEDDTSILEENTETIQVEHKQEIHAENKTIEQEDPNILVETPHDDSDVLNNDQQNGKQTPEVEESIENIQNEVEKQMADSTLSHEQETIIHANDDVNSSLDESGLGQEKSLSTSMVAIDPVVAKENISSLLNDWEDNDSQDDSIKEDTPAVVAVVVETSPTEIPEKSVDAENVDPQDKIKSLVSDWDEE